MKCVNTAPREPKDALDDLKPCPICGKQMMISWEGLYCPPCDYTYYQEDNETIVQTAERFNANRDNIAREIAFEVVE